MHAPRPSSLSAAMLAGLALFSACGEGEFGPDEWPQASSQFAVATGVVVRARATLLDNVGARMVVRVDGVVADPAVVEVRSTAFADYSFKTAAIGTHSTVDVVFVNDGWNPTTKVDRNLYVESITVAGRTLPSAGANVTYDVGDGAKAFDGLDTRPGQVAMGFAGALHFVVPELALPGVVVRARATVLDGVGAKMVVRVDGVVATPSVVEVRSDAAADFAFSATLRPGSLVDVVFTNDGWDPATKVDRNLYVDSLTVGGLQLLPASANVTYDVGDGAAAFDGLDVRAGQVAMAWSGALRFRVPGSASSSSADAGQPAAGPDAGSPPSSTGAVVASDHRVRMLYDADLGFSSQASYLDYYTGMASGAHFGLIHDIPESGLQVDSNPNHKAVQRLFSPVLGKNVFQTTIARSYPRTGEGTVRFTPGGAYSSEIGPGKEVWCGLSFVPAVIADFGGIHGLHHVNVGSVGLTPYTLAFVPKSGGRGQFQLMVRSTTTVNANGSWTLAPTNGGNPRATYDEFFFGDAAPMEHHKLVVNFRIGPDKQHQPFLKVWHKVGNSWEKGGSPVVSVTNRPIGHNLSNQSHQLRPTGIYNWHPADASSWPSAPNGIPAPGETGIRSLSRGGICLVADAPRGSEPSLTPEAVMGWLER